jgi:hypothetical protein
MHRDTPASKDPLQHYVGRWRGEVSVESAGTEPQHYTQDNIFEWNPSWLSTAARQRLRPLTRYQRRRRLDGTRPGGAAQLRSQAVQNPRADAARHDTTTRRRGPL